MKKYIDKNLLVAEIERMKEFYENMQKLKPVYESNIENLNELLSFLDTLEVKEVKEVDLEAAIKDYFDNQPIITRSKGVNYKLIPSGEDIAKHFFELGLTQVIDLNIPRTLIVYENKLYESDWIPRGCKDKCKNCPINSQCASEDLSLCEQYGLNPNDMHIVKELI